MTHTEGPITVRLKGGGEAGLTREAVAVAALDTPDARNIDVFALVGGRLIPVIHLVRRALGDSEPFNTNVAEMALRKLGFDIMVRRRFHKVTGEPVRLTQAQIKDSEA